ncbi:MAG: tryptophan--tRNA ligase [Eubacteriales bacterium]|nr:tryptophan--tRNA ligase [Eubacteriales bacterium]
MINDQKVMFSAMQATGDLTLGNYIGALANWVKTADDYMSFFSVVDQHSITVRRKVSDLRQNCRKSLAIYLAAGLDPEKHCIYYQSHVPAHAQLAWILSCHTYIGELNRMTQFKDKAAKNESNINAGLLTYPVLMAADILLYQADVVPVGVDQKQHLELTRTLAQRMNNLYGDIFTVPEPYITKVGQRIMSLQEPGRKMSKSDENPNATVFILDDKDTILRKFKRAVTDSDRTVRFDRENKPGISNLMEIYSVATGQELSEIEAAFDGLGYGEFKLAVGEAVVKMLAPLHERYEAIIQDKTYLDNIIKSHAEKANYFAVRTLWKVEKKVGFPVHIR